MNHNNPESQSHSQCVQDVCLGNEAKWKDIGEAKLVPNPQLFGLKKTIWRARCCGKAMSRYKKVQTRQCQKCNLVKDFVVEKDIVLCLKCGENSPFTCFED